VSNQKYALVATGGGEPNDVNQQKSHDEARCPTRSGSCSPQPHRQESITYEQAERAYEHHNDTSKACLPKRCEHLSLVEIGLSYLQLPEVYAPVGCTPHGPRQDEAATDVSKQGATGAQQMYEAEYGKYKQEQPEQIQKVSDEKARRVSTDRRELLRCVGALSWANRNRNQVEERLGNEADTG
jgi:hypothetical protein